MGFRLTPRSMTLDDLEQLWGQNLSEFRVISRLWEATTAKRTKMDLMSATKLYSPLNALFSDV